MEIIDRQRVKQPEVSVAKKSEIVPLRKKMAKQEDRGPVTLCIPWEQKRKEIVGDVENEEILRRVWQDNEAMAHMFIWHCLVSF